MESMWVLLLTAMGSGAGPKLIAKDSIQHLCVHFQGLLWNLPNVPQMLSKTKISIDIPQELWSSQPQDGVHENKWKVLFGKKPKALKVLAEMKAHKSHCL